MITRAPRPTSNFYMLDKAISEDRRLSWAARGVLIFLLGKPDHWQVSPAALTNETKGIKRSTGRDGVYAILDELKEIGYLQAAGTRDASGSFAGTDYLVTETPNVVFRPHPAQPDTAGPDTAHPHPANPPQASIEGKQSLKVKQVLKGESADAPRTPMNGAICNVLKALGMQSVNPSNPKLKALIDKGVDLGMFADMASECVAKGKGFAYLLAAIEGRMKDAAALADSALAAPAYKTAPARPQAESFAERDARNKREAWERMTGRQWPTDELPSHQQPAQQSDPFTLENLANITPRRIA